ncbi:MAG: hypothetical protein K2K81_05405 [Muribaculaceae bacterium]|nr:hypothetical protein [Muribaculaceae bacterium]MDE6683514.1 hypothetical protein [Muribaculaceae bacterium]
MEEREKIDDFEFEGTRNPIEESGIENEPASEEAPGKAEDQINEEEEPQKGESEEKQKDDSEEKEARIGKIERLFGTYPQTFSLLKDDKDFRADEKMENFMASLEGYARGSRLSAGDVDSSLSMLFAIGNACRKGAPTLDMMETLMKGQNFDKRLAEEVRAAELRGRNANIEAKMRNVTAGDGVPHLESRGGGSEKRSRGIFSLAESARR